MGNLLNILIIVVLVLVSITMFILAFAKPKQQEEITNRLEKIKLTHDVEQTKRDVDKKYNKLRQEVERLGKNFNPVADRLLNETAKADLEAKLIKAGKYDKDPTSFVANRVLLAVVFPILFLLLFILFEFSITQIMIFTPLGALAGYYYPMARLNRQIDERQNKIFKHLPTFLDLLTICLEAGMGINEALNKVVEKSKPSDLKDEVDRTLKEVQIGKPRLQALRDMAKRVDLTELSSVIIAIIQAEQMGTSLAKTLKIQSDIIRDIRWQKAQEIAQKAPVKMIIPIALFIFPTIFIIIFGPLAISFITNNR